MEFTWADGEQRLRAELKDFVTSTVRSDWTLYDRDMPTAESVQEVREYSQALADRQLLVRAWPEEYGGLEASAWEQTVISEELWGAGEPRGASYMNVTWIGPALMLAGTPEQKAYHLPRMARGETLWCQGFSEPQAGSDLSALRTRAERDGDHYVINGQKIWTSYAHAADYCFLLVRTDDQVPQRQGISILLVPMDTPGIEVREIPTLGVHHLVHEVFFTDVRVPASSLLGEENGGWNLIRTILANERIGLARHEHADRSLDHLVEEAGAAGIELGDPEAETLGRMAATVYAARLLNYVATDHAHRDTPDRAGVASVYRAVMADMEHGVSHAYLDVLGPLALDESSRGDYALMFSTCSTIASGTYEVQLDNVAHHVLGLPKG